MITLKALTSWFKTQLVNERKSKKEKQIVIFISFLAGILFAFLFVKIKLCKTLSEIFDSLFTIEGSTIVLVSTVLFFYLNLQEDEIDSKRIDFVNKIKETSPSREVLTENGKPSHYEKVETVLIDMLKTKLNEEVKYSEIKPK